MGKRYTMAQMQEWFILWVHIKNHYMHPINSAGIIL